MAIVDPNTVIIPSNIDLKSSLIVDQMVPRSVLGPGVLELELATKQSWHHETVGTDTPGSGSRAPNALPALPALDCKPADGAPTVHPDHQVCEPAAKRSRTGVLLREASDEHGLDKGLDKCLDDMAQKVRECFDQASFWCSDEAYPFTVSYWLKTFVDHALKENWTSGAEPPVARLFMKFVVKRAVASRCLAALPHFVGHMKRLEAHSPGLMPPLAKPLMRLAEKTENLSLEELPLATKTALVDSPLYKQFLEERLAEQVKVVKTSAGMDDAVRYARPPIVCRRFTGGGVRCPDHQVCAADCGGRGSRWFASHFITHIEHISTPCVCVNVTCACVQSVD